MAAPVELARFTAGDHGPDWLFAWKSGGPTSKRGQLFFLVDCVAVEIDNRIWLLPEQPTNQSPLMQINNAANIYITGVDKPVVVPNGCSVLAAEDGRT